MYIYSQYWSRAYQCYIELRVAFLATVSNDDDDDDDAKSETVQLARAFDREPIKAAAEAAQ